MDIQGDNKLDIYGDLCRSKKLDFDLAWVYLYDNKLCYLLDPATHYYFGRVEKKDDDESDILWEWVVWDEEDMKPADCGFCETQEAAFMAVETYWEMDDE